MADPGDKPKRATYQDVLDAPEHKVAEIINGELRLSPRPALPHASVASRLGYVLGPAFDEGTNGPGGWVILDEPELHLLDAAAPEIVVPDLAGWRLEKFDSAWLDGAFFTAAPDWVCEVLSPRTATDDRLEKLPIYAAAGVQHVWFLDPRYRSFEIFRLVEGTLVSVAVHIGNVVVRAEPFDAIELDLSRLWRELPVRPTRASEGPDPYARWDKPL